jgi:serine/threonine-protein kinase RsbW
MNSPSASASKTTSAQGTGGDRRVIARVQASAGKAGAAAEPVTRYQRTFYGRADQVCQVRRDIAARLAGHQIADEAVLIASELATNAVMHSASAGEFFTIRCEVRPTYVWVECEDLGGPWHCKPSDDRPHGLNIIEALAGPDNWGTEITSDGDRIVWVRLDLSPKRNATLTRTGSAGPDIEEVRGPLEHNQAPAHGPGSAPRKAAPGPLITQAAQAVKALDDLGLIIRLI